MKNYITAIINSIKEEKFKSAFKNNADLEYIKLCKRILNEGSFKEGRNGNTYSIFGAQVKFDLSEGIPLLTTKKVNIDPLIHELIWFLQGKSSAKYLVDNNVKIWDLWINEEGDLPFTYPKQWRSFPNSHNPEQPIDQIAEVLASLKNDPNSRRIIVSAWNPADVKKAALPWCHALFQFYVENGKLSCQLYQRSGDLPLGVPFNWASYAILTHIFAHLAGLEVGNFIWSGGDVHIYENQVESLKKQFNRPSHRLAKVKINPELKSIDSIKFEDITISDYVHEPFLKIPVSK